MIVVNPYGSLVADVRHDQIVAAYTSATVTTYSYYLNTPGTNTAVLQCVVTVTNNSDGTFHSAVRTNS